MLAIMTTVSKKEIDLLNPKEENILIKDIAIGLSRAPRFCGQISEFYSVADHSMFVSDLAFTLTNDYNLAMYGLLHDAHEAYIGDIPTPLGKLLGPKLKKVKKSLDKVIFSGINLKASKRQIDFIKELDRVARMVEEYYFRNDCKFNKPTDLNVVNLYNKNNTLYVQYNENIAEVKPLVKSLMAKSNTKFISKYLFLFKKINL